MNGARSAGGIGRRAFLRLYSVSLEMLASGDRDLRRDMTLAAAALIDHARQNRGKIEAARVAWGCLADVPRRALAGRRSGARRPEARRPMTRRDSMTAGDAGPGLTPPRRRGGSRPGHDLLQDIRFALRTLTRRPGISLVIVIGLAVGIGANTAIFSVVNTVLRRPLPFRDGHRLVRIYHVRDNRPPYISLRPHVFNEIEESARFFESIVAQRYTSMTLATDEGPERIAGLGVTTGWLDALGIDPVIGRGFTADEAARGRDSRVVVVSHGFWQRRAGGDRDFVGSSIRLDGETYVVVGVLPPGFAFPYENQLWFPLDLRREPDARWGLNVQARLGPEVSLEQARAELDTLGRRIQERYPESNRGMDLTAIPTREVLLGDQSGLVIALMAAVGFVLLIVCANVGSLLLARSVNRQRELAIRSALGAGRGRQIRQLLTESLVLAGLGGIGGLAVASWGNRFLGALVPGRMANVIDGIPVDPTVVAFSLAATAAAGIFFGMPLAVRASSVDPQEYLRSATRQGGFSGSHRMLDAFVVAELALAIILLTGASQMIGNFRALHDVDLGYDPDGLITMNVSLDGESYDSAQERAAFAAAVTGSLSAVPGVTGAGATTILPTRSGNFLARIEIEGRSVDPESGIVVNHRLVTPGFLPALGVPLLEGRGFRDDDRDDTVQVVAISQSMARRYWPGESPIGKRTRNVNPEADGRWLTIVGVVGDLKEFYDIPDTWYLPYTQHAGLGQASGLVLTVRTEGVPQSILGALQAAVWEVDRGLALFDVATVEELHGESLAGQRFGALLVTVFAAFGVIVAAFGLYSLTAYAVGRRRQEIGVRVALGARPADVLAEVMRWGLRVALLGVPIGLGGAIVLARSMRSFVTDVGPVGPLTLFGVTLILLAAGAVACWVPARRAMRLDPAQVLRAD